MKKENCYTWCLHCERCYPADFSDAAYFMPCFYKDCDGSRFGDGWAWHYVREGHENYPAIPEMNVVYPMYGGVPKRTESEKSEYYKEGGK